MESQVSRPSTLSHPIQPETGCLGTPITRVPGALKSAKPFDYAHGGPGVPGGREIAFKLTGALVERSIVDVGADLLIEEAPQP